MTLGEIIRDYREANDLSYREFSEISGLSKTYISNLEKNCSPSTTKPIIPSIDSIAKAAKAMFMDFDELFNMLDNDSLITTNNSGIVKKAIRIPILGRVAAGIPIEAVEDILGYEEISEKMARTGEFFALKIKGDSMEPRIYDGDVVIVRKQEMADSGDIVIALVNGDDAICKRLAKYGRGIKLMSLNPSYDPLFFTNEEIAEKPVRIIGKVVESRQKF